MLILWRTLLFAALWLAFEAVISWAAFCQHQNEYSSADQTTESYECVFRGPVASVARWFAGWWMRTFDIADAYMLFSLLFLQSAPSPCGGPPANCGMSLA
jgi:hypothetical protein